ncbi:MAG: hypothetical protein ACOYXT_09640, partial [Bacteroidota bacterium]
KSRDDGENIERDCNKTAREQDASETGYVLNAGVFVAKINRGEYECQARYPSQQRKKSYSHGFYVLLHYKLSQTCLIDTLKFLGDQDILKIM